MKAYTVLLAYPDHLTEDFQVATYLAHVTGETVGIAITNAQMDAAEENGMGQASGADFHVLAVFRGHLTDIGNEP